MRTLQQKKDYILELKNRGMTDTKIGKLLGVSHQRIHQIRTGYCSPASQPKGFAILRKDQLLSAKLTTVPMGYLEGGRDKFRERIRIRDNHTCQICFKKWKKGQRRFDVHHLDEKLEGKSAEKGICKLDKEHPEKMITLCHKCHLNLEIVRLKFSKSQINRWSKVKEL